MKKYIVITLFLCSILPTASASNNINSILDEVKTNNLELKSIEMSTKGEEYAIKSTNNLENPSADFEYLFGENNIGAKWGFGISQSFDWPGTYIARGKAIRMRVDALTYLKTMKSLDILLQTKLLCIDIININKQISVQRLIHKNILEFKDKYNKGFANGEISILDINKLNIESLNINQKLDDLNTQKRVALESLKAINGNIGISNTSLESLDEYSNSELKDIQYYGNLISTFDPQSQYENKMTEVGLQDIKINKMGYFPAISIGYKYSNELGEKFNGVTAGISIPIFSNRNKVNTAKANQIAQEYLKQNIVVSKQSDLISKYARLQYYVHQIKAYKSALRNNDNIGILNKALSGGQITLLNYLMEVRFFLEAEAILLDMEYSYQQLLTEIDKYELLSM